MSVNWYKAVENDLREYMGMLDAEQSIKDRLEVLNEDLKSVRGPVLDDVPISGGGSHYEDHLLNKIQERTEKRRQLAIVRQRIKMVKRGLKALNDTERDVIDGFYFNPASRNRRADALSDRLHCDRATVYRIREQAMRKMVLHCHGLPKT